MGISAAGWQVKVAKQARKTSYRKAVEFMATARSVKARHGAAGAEVVASFVRRARNLVRLGRRTGR